MGAVPSTTEHIPDRAVLQFWHSVQSWLNSFSKLRSFMILPAKISDSPNAAVATERLAPLILDGRLAAETLLLLDGEHHDAAGARRRRQLAYRASVIASEEPRHILNDGLEETGERVLQLLPQVVLGVERQAVLEHVDRVLGTHAATGASSAPG